MLERTAACLEPCGLRIIPAHNQPVRSTRQLYTAFWQHGAADIELSRAWQALMHGSIDAAPLLEPARSPSLNASAFLLDFLYPTGAISLMRRLAPVSATQVSRLPFRLRPSHVSPRLYASSSSAQETEPTALQELDFDAELEQATSAVIGHAAIAEPDDSTVFSKARHAAAIEGILNAENHESVDEIWNHYKSLDEKTRHPYVRRVLAFLCKAGRISDSRKISELFCQLDKAEWDSTFFVTAVTVELNLDNHSRALSIFTEGLRSSALDDTALVDGLDVLLAAAFKSPKPEFMERVWALYPDMAGRWNFDGVTASLKHLASVPDLTNKAIQFPQYVAQRLSDSSDAEADRSALDSLQKILVRRALLTCPDSLVTSLLFLTKDPIAFEEYILLAQAKGKKSMLTDVYMIYRALPDVTPSRAILHATLRAFAGLQGSPSKTLAGVELLWEDWHKFHDAPSRRAYQKHLAFYAARGDKDRVYSLWIEYIERFKTDETVDIFEGSDTFSHLLHVHAVNAEPAEAQKIFDDMRNKFQIDPSVYTWNILLNAYVKADDYDGAIATFENLCAATKPDKYSYGTIMQMAGERGDLGLTVELYRRARVSGVKANDAMMHSLVDAYCQNDSFKEAEDVCTHAASKGIVTTRLWNRLLYYQAVRRDLASINRILNTMADKNIPYNQYTYQQLLLGLALCRQSQHALHLLTVALKEGVFRVTSAHFNIVMGALIRTGEPGLVRRLCWLMKEHGIPMTEDIIFRLSQSLTKWHQLPPKERIKMKKGKWLAEAFRIFLGIYGADGKQKRRAGVPQARPGSAGPTTKPIMPSELLRSAREVYQFGSMTYIFAQLNDTVRVQELVDTYRDIFQGISSADDGVLPLGMLNAVMLNSLHDKQYDRVKSTWHLLFESAKTAASARSASHGDTSSDPSDKISAKYRYALCGGLRVMQELLFMEGNPRRVQALVREVLEAGFEVDSKNWNYHVQILVQMREYKTAFIICEKRLMANWTGWQAVRVQESMRNHISLDVRRRGTSPRYLRPTATTLYRLGQAYLELSRLSLWSGEAAQTLNEVHNNCAQAVRAVKSMKRVYSDLEAEIFDSGLHDSLDRTELSPEEDGSDGTAPRAA
ncbi:hypothetical protein F5Y17DRAFT_451409 [Xylariaceae sp. FL0594]|nr:hypothetical protein F5Y17DRAFT_451409 [Xylariaceae sp. FL0594]